MNMKLKNVMLGAAMTAMASIAIMPLSNAVA